MASVVDELNELLTSERGQVEAIKILLDSVARTDPDIADSGKDILETASWTCKGLDHRITQLGETSTLDMMSRLADRVSDEPDTKQRLLIISRAHERDVTKMRSVLKHSEIDEATQSFVKDLLVAHKDTTQWFESTLSQWQVDS